jgi:hypothetical protein
MMRGQAQWCQAQRGRVQSSVARAARLAQWNRRPLGASQTPAGSLPAGGIVRRAVFEFSSIRRIFVRCFWCMPRTGPTLRQLGGGGHLAGESTLGKAVSKLLSERSRKKLASSCRPQGWSMWDVLGAVAANDISAMTSVQVSQGQFAPCSGNGGTTLAGARWMMFGGGHGRRPSLMTPCTRGPRSHCSGLQTYATGRDHDLSGWAGPAAPAQYEFDGT